MTAKQTGKTHCHSAVLLRRLIGATIALLAGLSNLAFSEHIRPESILGDYRSAPEFGKDAIGQSIRVQIEDGRLNPAQSTVSTDQNIQLVVYNTDQQAHYLAITMTPDNLRLDAEIQKEIEQFSHIQYAASGGHSHAHSTNGDSEGSAMVRSIEENPRIYIPAGETKEMMFRLKQPQKLSIICLMPGHQALSGSIEVFE